MLAVNGLLQIAGDLVDAGLDAGFVLVAARRAGGAGRADHVFAGLDRQRAARRDHVAEAKRAGIWGLGDVLGELAGVNALGARGLRLVHGVLHGVGDGGVAALRDEGFADVADNVHWDV